MEQYESSIYSQQGEDGIIARIFEVVGTQSRYCVDIGAFDGRTTSNVAALEEAGWKACKLEGSDVADTPVAQANGVHKEWVTADNVVGLLGKYEVPNDFDFLSLDIDSIDYHVLSALMGAGYKPRAMVVEYNASYGPVLPVAVEYPVPEGLLWGDYYGASLAAFYYLLREYGYRLVYCENNGVNAFFVRDDLATEQLPALTPGQAYKPPRYGMVDRYGDYYGHEHRHNNLHNGWMEWTPRGLYE